MVKEFFPWKDNAQFICINPVRCSGNARCIHDYCTVKERIRVRFFCCDSCDYHWNISECENHAGFDSEVTIEQVISIDYEPVLFTEKDFEKCMKDYERIKGTPK